MKCRRNRQFNALTKRCDYLSRVTCLKYVGRTTYKTSGKRKNSLCPKVKSMSKTQSNSSLIY